MRARTSRGTVTATECRMGRWSPATTTRARGNGFTFSACNSKRHRAEEPNGSAVTSARSSTLSPRRRGNVRVVVDNRNSEGVQGVLGRVQWLLSLGQAPRERARLSLRIFGLDGMLFEAPNLLFLGFVGLWRSGLGFFTPLTIMTHGTDSFGTGMGRYSVRGVLSA